MEGASAIVGIVGDGAEEKMMEYTEQEANEYMARLAEFMDRRRLEIDFCRDKIEAEYMDEWIGRQFDA